MLTKWRKTNSQEGSLCYLKHCDSSESFVSMSELINYPFLLSRQVPAQHSKLVTINQQQAILLQICQWTFTILYQTALYTWQSSLRRSGMAFDLLVVENLGICNLLRTTAINNYPSNQFRQALLLHRDRMMCYVSMLLLFHEVWEIKVSNRKSDLQGYSTALAMVPFNMPHTISY